MDRVLSELQRLQVVALLHMARSHKAKVDDYQAALEQILQESPESISGSHSGDAIWEDYDADKLIERAGFTVEKAAP